MFTGVKEGIKRVLVTAFQEAFTQDFWNSLNPQVSYINPKDIVLGTFPDVQTIWPFFRVDVLINEAHWDNISITQKTAGLIGKGTFSTDIYALNSLGRDRLSDGLVTLLLSRQAYPGYNNFDSTLYQMAEEGYPRLELNRGDITFGTDDEGQGVPWEPNEKIYATTLSVGFNFAFAVPVDNLSQIIREIQTTVHMER